MTANALTVYEKIGDPLAYITNEKTMLATAAFVGCSPQAAPAVLLTCMLQNIDLLDYLRNYYPVNGRPTKQTQAAVADFVTLHGGLQRIVEFTPELSVLEFTDRNGHVTTWRLTIDEAHEAGWPFKRDDEYKDNWDSSVKRADMLYYRNASRALKKICPTIFAGLLSSEEAADLVDSEPTTAAARPTAAELLARAAAVPPTPPVETAILAATVVTANDESTATPDVENLNAAVEISASAEAAAEPAPTPTEPVGSVTRLQLDKLAYLRGELSLPQQVWDEALAKRGVKAAHSLSREQAQEIIDRLNARMAQLEPVKN